jgi:hypothetical protein
MKCLVFLLEEPSAQDALEAWLPKLLPNHVAIRFIVFQGKQDLERRMTMKLRHWLLPDSRFIVLRDQDSGDCRVIKRGLVGKCVDAGRPDAVVRIACRELEAFFVGDWEAVAEAFQRPSLAKLAGKANYRNPDRLGSPSYELKHHIPGYQKREGARRIAPLMNLQKNASASFIALIDAIQQLN